MKRHDVLNVLGVVQRLGYSLALVAAAIILVGFVLTRVGAPLATTPLAAPLVLLVATGLLLAWVSAATRTLVRRMKFETAFEEAQ
ncbi:hypothetical protein [Lysobacter sp. A3-1-A15]|uniref:hypothetical protein n=1 Tax=Novilysobacter viscosus TaxID=3098602 RepID=UPI002EDA60B3